MNTLLIINDNLTEAKHAAEFALAIAQKASADIILANNFVNISKNQEMVFAGDIKKIETDKNENLGLLEHLTLLNETTANQPLKINEFDISDMDEAGLAAFINANQIWMIVKGMPHESDKVATPHHINVQTVLNKVLCPLLLVPADWKIKDVERMVYIAD